MRFAAGTSQSVKDKFGASRGVDAEFFFFLADLEAGRAALDDQRRDSFFAFCRIRIHVNDGRVGHAAVGDPGFCAVDDVAVALANGLRGERRRVRAGLRLGQRVASDFFAARERHEEFLFLLVRAEAMDRIAIQRILHGKNHAGGSADAGNFLDHDGVGDVVEPRAAFGFRERQRRSDRAPRPCEKFREENGRSRRSRARAVSLPLRRIRAPCAAAVFVLR